MDRFGEYMPEGFEPRPLTKHYYYKDYDITRLKLKWLWLVSMDIKIKVIHHQLNIDKSSSSGD